MSEAFQDHNAICSGIGSSKYGQLGRGKQQIQKLPQQIQFTNTIFVVWTGEGHTLILTDASKLFSFGRNIFGQLGHSHYEYVANPTIIELLSRKEIQTACCGSEHSMAITVQGEVFTWGLNIKGQLGLGDTENRSAPTRVDKVSKNSVNCTGSNLERSERPIDISAGALHSLLTTDRNRLFSCGHGGNYALCLNSNEDMTEFQHIQALEGLGKIDKIACGLTNSASIIHGNLWIWGKFGQFVCQSPEQIGIESSSRVKGGRNSPRTGNVEDLACAHTYLAFIFKGELWTWGEGPFGVNEEAVKLSSQVELRSVSCGVQHTVAVGHNYELFGWGISKWGQLGDVSQMQQLEVIKEYKDSVAFYAECGSYHTLVLSYKPPTQKGKDRTKRRRPNEYLENNPIQFAKQARALSPTWDIPYEELEFEPNMIGKGGFGTVYRGRWRGTIVAIKKMNVDARLSPEKYQEFVNECQTMASLRHPNIVLFLGACAKPPNLCIVLEYCVRGALWDWLHDRNNPLPLILQCKIALDTARGVNYLHKYPTPVIHRDLKSLNLLLDEAMNTKLADFGWTRLIADDMTEKIGTYQWMAPEVISGQSYTQKADVYSFGIILWEIITRKPPYRRLNGLQVSQEVAKNDRRPPLPLHCPELFLNLMQRCWHRDPQQRPEFSQIITELENFMRDCERGLNG